MPLRRKTATRRKSTRKRVSFRKSKTLRRRKPRSRSGRVLIMKNPQLPFPMKTYCKLAGEIEGTITTATTLPTIYQFLGNTVNAPFNAGTLFNGKNFPNSYQNLAGLDPVGVNQYLASGLYTTGAQGIYNNFKVHGVSMRLQMAPEFAYGGTGAQSQQLFEVTSVPLKQYNATFSEAGMTGASQIDSASISNLPYSKTIMISPMKTSVLKRYYSIRKLYGLSKEQWRNVDAVLIPQGVLGQSNSFVGGRNASPTNTTIIQIMVKCGNSAQTTNNYPISYKLKCTWYVEFFNPIVNQYPNIH